MNKQEIQRNVSVALDEDLGGLTAQQGDITANLIPSDQTVTATIITREACVLAGQDWVTETFAQVDPAVSIEWHVKDAQSLPANQTICTLTGNARSILTAERTALNFLQTLSATATVTAEYVEILKDSGIRLLDTRKTLPGLRAAQKYAVTCGGGKNHRIGLYDAFLIKENHIMACGSIKAAVNQARNNEPGKPVEVEVETLDELQQAIDAGADIVMLDNFNAASLKQATALNQGRCKLEVSGNIDKARLQSLKDSGVDYISSGALTKHVSAVDLSLRISQ